MRHSIIYLCLVATLLSCCEGDRPEPELPPVTTTGANTFACKVNGKIWQPSPRPKGYLPQIEGGIVERYDSLGPEKNWYDLLIFADRDDLTGFQIFLSRINSPANYKLNRNTRPWPEDPQPDYSYSFYYYHSWVYMTDSIFNGHVDLIRYDTLNKIFSGTFEFKALHGTDTIDVTEGRFDIDQKKIN